MLVHGPYPIGEPRVSREARAAVQAGYEVDVIAMRRPGEPRSEVVDGVRVIRLPLVHRRGGGIVAAALEYVGFTCLAALELAVPALRRRYDVVAVHAPPDFLAVAALLPRLFGTRVLLDIHDLSPDMFAMRFGGRRGCTVADRALRAMERWATGVADEVVTVHEPYRAELVGRGSAVGKATVVMNSLDESLLPPPGSRNGGGTGFRVVYHGTVTPSYGVELLVEAAAGVSADVPGLKLEIFGEGDALPGIRRLAAERGLDGRLTASGTYLPHCEVLERALGASVGVIPNLPTRLNRFALSSKLFEYVALGVPVVSADLPTLREHFSDDEVRFFRAGDAGALADALLSVARDPEAARARARAASARYARYRWNVQARRYLEVLARCAPSPEALTAPPELGAAARWTPRPRRAEAAAGRAATTALSGRRRA
jgi:glycosyltransferase involved in cell wall biosynthesis